MYNKMDPDEPFDIKLWEKKRYWTTKAFTMECVMLGMEYSVTFLTLWLYIKGINHLFDVEPQSKKSD